MSFTPVNLTITNITQANPCVITVSTNHNMTTGEIIRITIPKPYGMQQLNGQLVQITNLSPTTFSLQFSQCNPIGNINVDSTNFQDFTNVGTGTPPQVTPVGSGPTPINTTTVAITNNICDSLLTDANANIATTNQPF